MSNMTTTDKVLNFSYGATELTCAVVGAALNLVTMPYFVGGKRQISGVLYILIVITDISICACCLPSGVSMVHNRDAMWLGSKALCTITGFIFNISSRMSVFLIAVLSVARSLSMCLPFHSHSSAYHLPLIALYFLLNVVLASLPFFYTTTGYVYGEFLGQCGWGIESLSFVKTTESSLYTGLLYTFIILPWLLPGLVVVLSCFISVYFIAKSGRRREGLERSYRKKDRVMMDATVTIVIMTIVYIIFNMPCWIFFISALVNTTNPVMWLRSNFGLYFNIFVGRLSVVMNSFINPLVYFCRIRGLRRSVVTIMHRGSIRHTMFSWGDVSYTSHKRKMISLTPLHRQLPSRAV